MLVRLHKISQGEALIDGTNYLFIIAIFAEAMGVIIAIEIARVKG